MKLDKIVYLFTFPPTPHVYNVSPFAIKVESFLRLHQIPYEAAYTTTWGPKGQIPYVRLGNKETGELIPDSNVIIPRLKKEFDVDRDSELTPAERAVAHAFNRMIEEHTCQILFYYRYGLNMEKFIQVLELPDRFFNAEFSEEGRKTLQMMRKQPETTMNKTKYRGLTRHTDEEKWAFSNDDIKAISDYLGEKKFFFGDEATTIDCILFGHLSQVMYIPLDFPQKKYIDEHCPNLVHFMERFKSQYWPDWEDKCKTKFVVPKYQATATSDSTSSSSN